MTTVPESSRTISAEGISRVLEGEGSLRVRVQDGRVVDVALDIFEPPRLLRALLVGRHFTRKRQISRRESAGSARSPIRCPPASPWKTRGGVVVERDRGPAVDCCTAGSGYRARAAHLFAARPDFLGCADAVELADLDPIGVTRGLDIKRTGNLVMQTVGGRAVHPGQRPRRWLLPFPRARLVPSPGRAVAAVLATRPWRRSNGSPDSSF